MSKSKKIQTLQQLVKFCEENKFYSFNSKETGYKLSVQVPVGTINFSNKTNSDTRGLLFCDVKVCHTDLNRNGSYISEKNMRKAMPSLKYRPFLAYIHQLDSGEYDFEGHNMEIIKDENGKEEIIYLEQQVGTFTSEDPYLEYDPDMDKTYVKATVVIPEEYTKAADIIKRKNGTKVSCELNIDSMSYNAKEKYLELTDFYFNGCVGLGSTTDGTEIGEGMLGSRADIKDFSIENNSICSHMSDQNNDKLVETLEKLNLTLSNFNINQNQRKEETELDNKENFDENVTAPTEKETSSKEINETEVRSDNMEEDTPEMNKNNDTDGDHVAENENTTVLNELIRPNKYSITMSDGTIKEFDLSLDDIQSALYNLVNDTYAANDNTYYGVSVYDNYLVMHDWWRGKNYKQTYNRVDDNYSLTGDRVEVYSNWLTKDEENALNDIRNNYSKIESELNKYKTDEENSMKEKLFQSNDYKNISESEDFINLRDNRANYSYDELVSKLDEILLSYAKNGNIVFDTQNRNNQKINLKLFNSSNNFDKKTKSRYGNLKFN